VAGGFPGEGLTEDASATLALASRGVTITYVPGASVRGAMPGSLRSIGAQDRRWEGGRLRLAPRAMHVAAAAIVRGRLRSAAAALEVAAPPLTLVGVGSSLAVVASVLGLVPAWLGAAPAVALTGYVMAGWLTLGARGSDISALAWAPLLIARKALTYATLVRPPASWQRTERD
jgi:cellulose synthase/poly-beta-1,6-N-acetylglucosamine synthase-like glycosyltransferase